MYMQAHTSDALNTCPINECKEYCIVRWLDLRYTDSKFVTGVTFSEFHCHVRNPTCFLVQW